MPSYDIVLAEALIRGMSQRKAALMAGISQPMVQKRMQQEDFQALLAQKQDELGVEYPLRFRLKELLVLLQDVYVETLRFDKSAAETSAEEARRHLSLAIQFLDEWAWTLEEECAG